MGSPRNAKGVGAPHRRGGLARKRGKLAPGLLVSWYRGLVSALSPIYFPQEAQFVRLNAHLLRTTFSSPRTKSAPWFQGGR